MKSEAKSKSNSGKSNVNCIQESRSKGRRYHRHTPEQIEEMEAFFRECPHPNSSQRLELSQHLGMDPQQIKFWFQNKRNQMKMHQEQKEYNQLRAEHDKLRAQILRVQEAHNNTSCLGCELFHQRQLGLENNRLGPMINGTSSASNIEKTVSTSIETPSPNPRVSRNFRAAYVGSSSSMNDDRCNKGIRQVAVDVAIPAMDELLKVAQLGQPLWFPSMDQNSLVFNEEEYLRAFPRVFRQRRNGYKFEASRESVVVPTCAAHIAEILMNVEQWANVFSGVVSRAVNVQVISPGLDGTLNEAIIVVDAEFQVPSPHVSTRGSHFLRYCKWIVDGVLAVVDVSLDHPNTASSITCRRRPSGCLVQDIANGHSKITWVEHVEVEDGGIPCIYKPLIASGLAFGARRWVAILEGYCQRLVRTFSAGVPTENANNLLAENQGGRRSVLKLAETMVTKFCRRVSASTVNTWTTLSGNGNENVKFMTRTNVDDPSMPIGVLLSIATSFWLPNTPKSVFDFLRDNNTRKMWDVILRGGDVEEMAHIVSGEEEFDRVTLYRIKDGSSSSSQVTVLQESRSDPTAYYVVYAPIHMDCTNAILAGDDPSKFSLLPSGFAILPDGPIGRAAQAETGGSLVTVALQIVIGPSQNANPPMESATIASNLIWSTVNRIKQGLVSRS